MKIINFRGFQNTGIGIEVNPEEKVIKKRGVDYIIPKYKHLTLNTKLNNIGEKDLEKFGLILKRFPNVSEKNSVNFSYDEYYSNIEKKTKREFWLNDRPLVLKDENLPVFSKLAKLFSRLSLAKDSELKQAKDYCESVDCRYNFSYFNKCTNPGEFEYMAQGFHMPSNVRKNASAMVKEFEKIMTNYFE